SSEVDSRYVFEDLIFPVLEEKCITCHNENRAYGGLNMNAFESMMEGGNSGSGIQKGKPYESLIYKRISFPQDHPKFMPPAGVPMSYDQIAIMEWWIDKGAKKQMPINLARNDAKMLRLMEVLYKFDLREKTYLETLKLPGLSSEELNGLNDEKFIWRFLNAEKSFLDVKFTAKTIQKVDLLIMQKVKENVTWLNLADCMLSDELLSYLGTFRNLTRLKIQKNPLITDKGIDGLKELKNLSELNLYGTSVTDAAFSTLGQMTALKKLFLWNTLVTPSGIKNFKTQNPEIEVIAGL
ncbi:MAG: c-type cytochrome domain-containing protein, partial [Bacteroidota bacterium]|nr:c-type cytochrome domain-containing protein [Bacteroidota bacterium]